RLVDQERRRTALDLARPGIRGALRSGRGRRGLGGQGSGRDSGKTKDEDDAEDLAQARHGSWSPSIVANDLKRTGRPVYFLRVYSISMILAILPAGFLPHISSLWWSLSVMVILVSTGLAFPVDGSLTVAFMLRTLPD